MTENTLAWKKAKVAELEAGNQRSYTELLKETRGASVMDTSDKRREVFFEMMVKWGIITEEQFLDFEIEFHTQVENALNSYWEQWREAKKPKLATPRKTTLLGPNGQPLT